jgi:hypothetical protein
VLPGAAGDASGVVTCAGGGVDAGDSVCGFSACLGGDLPYAFGPQAGCGTVGDDTLYWADEQPTATQTDITLHLSSNVTVDQVGPLPLDKVEITRGGLGADGGLAAWITPSGACTATLVSSTCAPTTIFPTRRILTGHGTCTQPAAPEPGTSLTAVTVGDFAFTGFIEPP